MEGAITAFSHDLAGLRTGRASATMIDHVIVDAYGSKMPIEQVGTISVPEARTISIQVWDKGLVISVEKAIQDERILGKALPENIEKLVSFMEETGGTIEDYTRLNADYSKVDDVTLLKEYYKKEKPYLEGEDIDMLLEDFIIDEDIDEDRDARKKRIAFKEEVAKAKNYLEETKSKYYDEIKLRPGTTQDQQKATDFFNRYNKQQETAEQQHAQFKESTKEHFNDNFEGFDIKVGEKSYKYNIQNRDKVAESQSNINNLVGKFLDSDGNVKDAKGYHKAMYAADNVDKIASHFYEQGKSDAMKTSISKSKNIQMGLSLIHI